MRSPDEHPCMFYAFEHEPSDYIASKAEGMSLALAIISLFTLLSASACVKSLTAACAWLSFRLFESFFRFAC